ncbi:SpoIIE family protein phosphatase [Microscilla marina]|uniref:Serine/threonine kinase with GAF domain n=1 Tax=Microscilla marina ATCC 23134 TaxID=313606 RepID=A1ZD33_MICM2|nr:SpoIIE family protein phosphatase [Microscilla marina]EAY31572.1 serine/threonine kinase with GAF domain [Microscilla marina ATCC 23134]
MNDNDELLFANDGDNLFADEDDNGGGLFAEEDGNESSDSSSTDTWKVMIVDDEEEIHTVTRFALSDYKYKGKHLEFIDAYTGVEAQEKLAQHDDIAVMLLDVVMESHDAGLQTVKHVREKLDNHFVRIILRTGQPGQAPEESVITDYDINDYKNKTELTDKRLFTTITTGLRSYADIMAIEHYRQNLEKMVEERTKTIQEQTEELEMKNFKIIGSINAARRIQSAMLPQVNRIKKALPEMFILFRPRDIVSGDFYWFSETAGRLFIAAIDCTGHGVPGAFMSMLGDALLNQIVNIDEITSPDRILNRLHRGVRKALKQDLTENRDGMDMAFCMYDKQAGILEFSGAKNPLLYVQNGEMHKVKGDKMPIGGVRNPGEERIFTRQVVKVDQPTTCYMFSDGYADQFGGPDNRKFMSKKLRNLLLENHQKPFEEQQRILEQRLDEWQGDYRQMDDILVMGFKVGY